MSDEAIVRAALHGWVSDESLDALDRLVAQLKAAEAVIQAARELLRDDDMPNHWGDCFCSYCTRNRALRDALAALEDGQ